jgi:hemerythrin-like domain-containing protein
MDHQHYLELCDRMEEIADTLPDKVSVSTCTRVIQDLSRRVAWHHHFEEVHLFPVLRARARADDRLIASLNRLESEHRSDEGYADEIVDLLSALANGTSHEAPNTAGYMLRGLFQSLRRHIAFENEYVLPLARRMLSAADLARLERVLTSR